VQDRAVKPAKIGRKWANMGNIRRNQEENCGNRPFAIDFSSPEVAL
jgi:hypothetical protein